MTTAVLSAKSEVARPQRTSWRASIPFYAFVAPWIIGLVLFTVFPLGWALILSLTNWDGTSSWDFIGVDNYTRALSDPTIWSAMGRTLLLAAVIVPFNIVGGLGLALMLNRPMPGRYFFRTLVYIPAVIPPVASAVVWKLLFNRDAGAVNGVIDLFGGPVIDWFSGNAVFVVLIFVLIWGVGGGVILNLAALQDISQDLYDAAKVDGAGRWLQFTTVTLPAISPIVLYQVVTGVIGAMQTFVPVLLLSPNSGAQAITGVPESNRIYMVEVYAQYFAYSRYGYASALLWLLFTVILLITFLTFKIGGRSVFYAVDPTQGG